MIKQGKYLTSFQRKLLLKSLPEDLRPEYRLRIQIMLLADTGESQAQICAELGCAQETARYWITMAQSGNAHKWNDRPKGRPKSINQEYLNRLKELVSHSPRDYGYSFGRWTAHWLSKHLAKEFDIKVSEQHINRLLKEMGLSTRQTSAKVPELTIKNKDSSITIGDLPSCSDPEILWQFSLLKTSN